jgi:hypothetical protein
MFKIKTMLLFLWKFLLLCCDTDRDNNHNNTVGRDTLFVAHRPKVFSHSSWALMADKQGTSLGQTLPASLRH